jgi:hypothetical protein
MHEGTGPSINYNPWFLLSSAGEFCQAAWLNYDNDLDFFFRHPLGEVWLIGIQDAAHIRRLFSFSSPRSLVKIKSSESREL